LDRGTALLMVEIPRDFTNNQSARSIL